MNRMRRSSSQRPITVTRSSFRSRERRQQNRKLALTMAMFVAAFLISCLPWPLTLLLCGNKKNCALRWNSDHVLVMTLIHAIIIPLLYGFRIEEVNRKVKDILRKRNPMKWIWFRLLKKSHSQLIIHHSNLYIVMRLQWLPWTYNSLIPSVFYGTPFYPLVFVYGHWSLTNGQQRKRRLIRKLEAFDAEYGIVPYVLYLENDRCLSVFMSVLTTLFPFRNIRTPITIDAFTSKWNELKLCSPTWRQSVLDPKNSWNFYKRLLVVNCRRASVAILQRSWENIFSLSPFILTVLPQLRVSVMILPHCSDTCTKTFGQARI